AGLGDDPCDIAIDHVEPADVDDEAGGSALLDRQEDVGLERLCDGVAKLDVDRREQCRADPEDGGLSAHYVPTAVGGGGGGTGGGAGVRGALSATTFPTIPSASSIPSLSRLTVCIAETSTPSCTIVLATCAVIPVRIVCAPSRRTAAVVLRRWSATRVST